MIPPTDPAADAAAADPEAGTGPDPATDPSEVTVDEASSGGLDVPVGPVLGGAPTAAPAPGRRLPMLPIAIGLVVVLAGAALFMSGFSMGRQTAVEPGTPVSEDEAFRPFWDTYHTITERYAGGEVDRDAIIQGAVRGMIDALDDPYSSYLTSDEYRQTPAGDQRRVRGDRGGDRDPGCGRYVGLRDPRTRVPARDRRPDRRLPGREGRRPRR